jgi:hydrogenase expression/formation protein HypC
MCLAIPSKVVLIGENNMAQVDIHGITRTVSLDLVPEAEVGDWVLVHAGFGIQIVDEQFADEVWDLMLQMGDALDPADAELVATVTENAAAVDDPTPA